ncbi:helix-turn-helix transcriptional regulator [Dysosmobacter welbionis]|uniref:helix-turn-helix domain-containing protein n=1 Tax=Dysosmobacter welbionis TaxID=2093857 RepID=UPI0032C1093A
MKKQLNVEIGGRIRKTREALGYSREALAEKADLATSFIGTIELGTGSFTAESLIKLCHALGTSADYILFGAEEQSDLSTIDAMLSGLDSKYIPYVEDLLSAYLKSLRLSGK